MICSKFLNLDTLSPKPESAWTGGGETRGALVVREVSKDAYQYMKSGHAPAAGGESSFRPASTSTQPRTAIMFGDIVRAAAQAISRTAGNAGEYYTPRAVTQFIVQHGWIREARGNDPRSLPAARAASSPAPSSTCGEIR
jgi:hypothetical protein